MSKEKSTTRTGSRSFTARDKTHQRLSTFSKVWVPGFFAAILVVSSFWNLWIATQVDARADDLTVSIERLSVTLERVARVAACVDPNSPHPEECGLDGGQQILIQLYCFEYMLHQITPPPELNCELTQQPGGTP